MFHLSFFFFLQMACSAAVQISRKAVISSDHHNSVVIKRAKCLMAALVLFFADSRGLTFRRMLTQLTNRRAFKLRCHSVAMHSICDPFVELSGCLQNASQKDRTTILPRNHITGVCIFSAFYTLPHLFKSHSTHLQLTTHLSKFNPTAVS